MKFFLLTVYLFAVDGTAYVEKWPAHYATMELCLKAGREKEKQIRIDHDNQGSSTASFCILKEPQ